MNRTGRTLLVVVALLLAGSAFLWLGRPQDPPPLPVPSVEFDSPSVKPTGPTTAPVVVDKKTVSMTPEQMGNNTIFIPSIEAYSPIKDFGKKANNDLALPEGADIMARYRSSAELNATQGNTLLAGHITYNNERGPLYNMADMQPGQRAFIKDADGVVQEFMLVSLKSYVKTNLPSSVWTVDGERKLTVVTCGGPVEQTSHGRVYRDNLVTIFLPVDS